MACSTRSHAEAISGPTKSHLISVNSDKVEYSDMVERGLLGITNDVLFSPVIQEIPMVLEALFQECGRRPNMYCFLYHTVSAYYILEEEKQNDFIVMKTFVNEFSASLPLPSKIGCRD